MLSSCLLFTGTDVADPQTEDLDAENAAADTSQDSNDDPLSAAASQIMT